MAGMPWEDFQAPAKGEDGPWTEFQKGEIIPAKSGGTNDPLSPASLKSENTARFWEEIKGNARKQVNNAIDLADMALGVPGQLIGVGTDIGGRISALARGGSRSDAEWAGKSMREAPVIQKLSAPLASFMEGLGWDRATPSDVSTVMGGLMKAVEGGGEWVNEKTGGALSKEDTVSLFNTAMGALGARGTSAVVQPRLDRLAKTPTTTSFKKAPPPPGRVEPELGEPAAAPAKVDKNSTTSPIIPAALAATGLGLAYEYGDEEDLAAAAAIGGAALTGRGKGLTLADVAKLPETAPLETIRRDLGYTFLTLERLPGGRAVFDKKLVEEQLRRPDVTKAEKELFAGVLAGSEGPTISAKRLVEGLKVAADDWELKKAETEEFADYGLNTIDRWAEGARDPDVWVEMTPEERAFAARGEVLAITHLWQLPELDLGTANHFQDPNYFGHTRAFWEDGVRHVVEVQSDLAQKAGKSLTAEEVAALTKRREVVQQLIDIMRAGQILDMREIDSLAGQADIHLGPEARRNLTRLRALLAEIDTKLASSKAEQVSPLLKHWPKRLVREELADAARNGEATARFATADTVAKVEGWPEGNFGDGSQRFRPEHQSIYDRYRTDVEKFLRQLGGREYTDPQGHTWIEVPTAGSKAMPAGTRPQMFGGVDPKLAASIAAIGGGAALASYLTKDPEGKAKSAALTAAVISLGLYARSRSPAIAEWAKAAGRAADYGLGAVSTRLLHVPALRRRLRNHERAVLTTTNDDLREVAPFVESLRRAPKSLRDDLNAALLTNDPQRSVAELSRLDDPAIGKEWAKVRGTLERIGQELQAVGRLRELLPDYYPRVVTDVEGLLRALGTEQRSVLEQRLESARATSIRRTGEDLTPLETSLIINKYLKTRSGLGTGRPGFLKQRGVDEVTAELLPFYAPASESLPIYIRAARREIERARFFGDNLVRDPETGMTNIDASIGNVVNEARLTSKMTEAQVDELRSILGSRFGPGERASSAPVQTIRNLTNIGLLGQFTSAAVQIGDLASSVYAYGALPTIKAFGQVVTRRPQRIRVSDLGLVNHLAEEIVAPERQPLTIAGRQLSTAKFVESAFRLSGFSLIDQFGKAVSINAAKNKYARLAQTPKGLAELRAKYGEAFGSEFDQLVADLRSGEMTDNVKSLVFSELSDIQPISRAEMPQGYLDNPNGRLLYQLKTWMLKQADIVRRDVAREFAAGNYAKATSNALRYSLLLGISGATMEFIRNFFLGKDDELEWGDIPANMLKTFGWSQYVKDQVQQGKLGEAAAGVVTPPFLDMSADILKAVKATVPPYSEMDEKVQEDPKAVNYLPLIGRLLYMHAFGGAERANEREEKRRAREEMEE